jgi:DNA repair protein RadC
MEIGNYNREENVFHYLSTKKLNTQLLTSMDAYERMYPFFNFGLFTIHREMFFALLLDKDNKQIGFVKLSSEAEPYINVDIQRLLKEAVIYSAEKIMVAHNSITNDTRPTEQDDYFTQVLKQACSQNQLVLQDHLIISEYGKYYSYADNLKIIR